MIGGLERLYAAQSWAPGHPAMRPDPSSPRYSFNPAFEGAMEIEAAEALYRIVLREAGGRRGIALAETGTCDGFSTCFIARAIQDAGRGGGVWTCERDRRRYHEDPRPWPGLWADLGVRDLITACIGDSRRDATWSTAPSPPVDDVPFIPLPSRLDVVFLDSDHDAETIAGEWDLLGPRLQPGGLVVMHDTELYPEVGRCAKEIAEELGGLIERHDSCRGLWSMRKQP